MWVDRYNNTFLWRIQLPNYRLFTVARQTQGIKRAQGMQQAQKPS